MRRKINLIFLRIFDLALALGFILTGIMMINSNYGIFVEDFPKELSDVLPFENWIIPGLVFIIVFGFGNIAAFVCSFIKKEDPYRISLFMGCILLIFMMAQVTVAGKWYLASSEIFILSLFQITFSIAHIGWKRRLP